MKRVEHTLGPKAMSTRKRIIDGAAFCLANYGEKATTFQKIADHCEVSQPLVVHYFKKSENIFCEVVTERMSEVRRLTKERLAKSLSPTEKLLDYFKVSWELFRLGPDSGRLYCMLLSQAVYDPKLKKLSTYLKRKAVDRIERILREGIKTGDFTLTHPRRTAKTIHNTLVGFLLGQASEIPEFSDQVLLESMESVILNYLQSRD